jgi:hypothetical protein
LCLWFHFSMNMWMIYSTWERDPAFPGATGFSLPCLHITIVNRNTSNALDDTFFQTFSITGWSSCGVNPHEIQSIIEHVGKTVSWVLCSYSFYYESLFSEANIGHLFQVVLVTARPLYRRNTKHAHEKKNHEGSDHNLKNWRDGSQNSKHTLQQSRSMKWKIHHYKPVQVMV